jgi:hypothetical protein
MSSPVLTTDDLLALFAAKAAAPPPEATQLLVRHLKCKESIELARFVSDALRQYAAEGSQRLPPPTELLPPLG